MASSRFSAYCLVHDAVAQRADAGNLDFEHVAGLHPERRIATMADALRCAGGDDVARRERREIRAERNDLRHRIDQQIGAGVLHLLAVEAGGQRQPGRVGNFVGGDDPRAERAGRGKVLAGGHRELLVVAHAAVHETGVARDMLQRALDRDVTAARPDHHRKLAFEIEVLRDRRTDHLAVVAGQRVGKPDEHARLLRQFASGLGGVRAIVDAGAEDLVRIRNRRKQLNVRRACGRVAPPFGRPAGPPPAHRPQARRAALR